MIRQASSSTSSTFGDEGYVSEESARAGKLIDIYDEVDGALPPEALAELQELLNWVQLDKPEPPPFTWTVCQLFTVSIRFALVHSPRLVNRLQPVQVAVDGSDVSWNAMRVAAGLFKYTRDELRVLHITKIKYLPGEQAAQRLSCAFPSCVLAVR